MAIELWPYQVAAIKAFYATVAGGHRSIMLCAPTGAGKTLTALALFEHLTEHGKSANFVVDRTVLLKQTSNVFIAEAVYARLEPAPPGREPGEEG